MVYNVLIDVSKLHQVVLFADDLKCKKWADRSPPNLNKAVTINRGTAQPTNNGTNCRWYGASSSNFRPVLAKDTSALIAQREQKVAETKDEHKKIADEAKDVRRRAENAKKDVEKCVSPIWGAFDGTPCVVTESTSD